MAPGASLIRIVRLIHLYSGIFIAPAVLFFAITGALQTASLHETTRGSDYKPPQWIAVMAQLHKKQTTTLPPPRKPQPAGVQKESRPETRPESRPEPANPIAMKAYFLVVSAVLIVSTFTGIYMAYKFTRNKGAILAVLAAGVVVPGLLLLF